MREGRQQRLFNGQRSRQVDRGRYHVIRALAHVDVIVRVDRHAGGAGGEGGQHFVRIHIRAGAGAGLEDVDRKLVIVRTRQNHGDGVLDRERDATVEQAEIEVDASGSALDLADSAYEAGGHDEARDRKVLDRALGLRGVQRCRGDFQFAHAVALDAHCCFGHAPTPMFRGRQI